MICRGFLRHLLGRYLGARPADLIFAYGPNGKPALSGRHASIDLSFNLSHSEDLALFSITRGYRLGVDVERKRPLNDLEGLTRQILSQAEQAELRSVPAAMAAEVFWTCWTAKEAYVKARGEGLSISPERIAVAFKPTEAPRLVSVDGDLDEAARWSLLTFAPSSDYLAAVVVEGQVRRVTRLEWFDATGTH
jgi:4'-phosphopantetheinyl transferase